MDGRRRARLFGRGGEIELHHPADVGDETRYTVTASDLRDWLLDPSPETRRALLDAYEDVGGRLTDATSISHTALRDVEVRLQTALERGHLVAVRARPKHVALAAPARPPAAPTNGPKAGPPTRLTWISIQLVDQDKKPIPGIRFEVTAPNGTSRSGVLDEHGSAYLEPLPVGDCQVRFPDLDTMEWNAG